VPRPPHLVNDHGEIVPLPKRKLGRYIQNHAGSQPIPGEEFEPKPRGVRV
jgi:hypothetical protein